jgi:hypothetical protein
MGKLRMNNPGTLATLGTIHNTTVVTNEAETDYPSDAPDITSGF